MDKRKIIESTGYSLLSEEEQQEVLAELQAADDKWEEEVLLRSATQNEHRFQQRVEQEQQEWESRSLWDKVTKGRFIPIR